MFSRYVLFSILDFLLVRYRSSHQHPNDKERRHVQRGDDLAPDQPTVPNNLISCDAPSKKVTTRET
jgi:hypothetical protein